MTNFIHGKIILRENYLKKIWSFYDSKYIKAITGVRRCGNSELLLQIIIEIKNMGVESDHIIVFDLEGKMEKALQLKKWRTNYVGHQNLQGMLNLQEIVKK